MGDNRTDERGGIAGRLIGFLFSLPFLLFGLFAIYAAVTGVLHAQEVADTVVTGEANVVSKNIERMSETEEGEVEYEFYPQVTYEYTVDGKTYTGERIYPGFERSREAGEAVGKEFDSRRQAEAVLSQLPTDRPVTVYYFPDDPGRAFLVEPTVNWIENGFFGVFGLVFALVGLVVGIGSLFGEADSDDGDGDVSVEFGED